MENKLPESYIQEEALHFLRKSYYARCPINGIIYWELEAHTTDGKRADGLLIFKQKGLNPFVASLEAKSATTINNLVEQLDSTKIYDDSLKVAGAATVAVSIIFWIMGMRHVLDPFMVGILSILWFWFAYGSISVLTNLSLNQHKSIGALNQLKQYPADELWLAIGEDSLNNQQQYQTLVKHCRKEKVGLIMIYHRRSPKVKVHPKFNTRSDVTNYALSYKNVELAQEVISEGRTKFGYGKRTRAESKYRFMVYSSALSFGLIAIIIFSSLFKDNNNQGIDQLPTVSVEDTKAKSTPRIVQSEVLIPKENSEEQTIGYQEMGPECHFFKFLGTRLLLVDKRYRDKKYAEERVALLRNVGFKKAGYFWLPCYKNSLDQEVFCVHPYDPRETEDQVNDQLDRYRYITRKNEINNEDQSIIRIQRPE